MPILFMSPGVKVKDLNLYSVFPYFDRLIVDRFGVSWF